MRRLYDINFTYNDKDVVTGMSWSRNAEADEATRLMHGKYLLQTSLDEKNEENIRTVEETFKTLIMSTQQRVTLVAEQDNGHLLKVRRSTTPEVKLAEIQDALGITPHPVCSIKSVWLREHPPSKSGG